MDLTASVVKRGLELHGLDLAIELLQERLDTADAPGPDDELNVNLREHGRGGLKLGGADQVSHLQELGLDVQQRSPPRSRTLQRRVVGGGLPLKGSSTVVTIRR